MTLRVAVTRASPGAEASAARLRSHGAHPVLAPLLTIVPCAFDTSIEGAQALIFTSANGVRAFPDLRGARTRLVLAVGDATAQAAHAAGFANVRTADGDVDALAQLAKATLDPAAGRVIHIRGAHVAGDVAGQLAAAGFQVETRIAYAAIAASQLPAAFGGPLDIVLFHSARAAHTFAALGAPGASRLTAACLSPAVAHAAAAAPWARVLVASAPHEDALIAATLAGQDTSAGASA